MLPVSPYKYVDFLFPDYSTNQLSLVESLEKLGSSSLSKEADTGIGKF